VVPETRYARSGDVSIAFNVFGSGPFDLVFVLGAHTGECEEIAGKVGGLATIIGARISGVAGPGEVLTSATVRDLTAGSGLQFDDRGVHQLKGVPGEWRLFSAS